VSGAWNSYEVDERFMQLETVWVTIR